MTKEELRRAADILESEAHVLRTSHTVGGMWPAECTCGFGARDLHDEMRGLAKKLRGESLRRKKE